MFITLVIKTKTLSVSNSGGKLYKTNNIRAPSSLSRLRKLSGQDSSQRQAEELLG